MKYTMVPVDLMEELPSGAYCVLVALLSYADRNGVCFPAVPTLAKTSGVSERSITRHLQALENAGYVERVIGNGHKVTVYQINHKILYSQNGNPRMTESRSKNDKVAFPLIQDELKDLNSSNSTHPQETPSVTEPKIEEEEESCLASKEENLIFPAVLDAKQQASISKLLQDNLDAQSMIDELAGVMESREVRNPVGYLRQMVRRGDFVPELGIAIAERRNAAQEALVRADMVKSQEEEPVDVSGLSPEWAERLARLSRKREVRYEC